MRFRIPWRKRKPFEKWFLLGWITWHVLALALMFCGIYIDVQAVMSVGLCMYSITVVVIALAIPLGLIMSMSDY